MIGKTVSHYKIIEKIGAGGMGEVYKAQDLKLDRFVALKFLPQHLTTNEVEKQRFIHEAKAASALQHNNICAIHEIDETEDGQIFICMDYYEGQTLNKKIKDRPLPLDEAIDIAIQIAEGVAIAHESNITHRDLKPANIMITNRGEVKIVDFGLAKSAGQTKLTKEGTTLGTVAYMSPEQTRGEKVDFHSDIWSLGVLIYEMVTGKLPFKGDYDQVLMYAIINEEPAPITSLRTGIPLELERITTKCLQKIPADRYQHVDELIVDLRSLKKEPESISAPLKEESLRKRLKTLIVSSAILLIFILIVAGYFFIFEQDKSEITDAGTSKWENSIAVLPFADLSPEKDQEYFCDGMTEQIITNLAKLNRLKVIGRTSVMKFRNTEKTLPEIGNELNVAQILEGSVRKYGTRIRVTAQLINTEDGSHLWAENYDRELENIFAVQDDISGKITGVLFHKLSTKDIIKIKSKKPANTKAYDYYLKATYFWNKFNHFYQLQDFYKSEEMFKKAIGYDPNYALSYANLSDLYGTYININPEEKEKYLLLQEKYIKIAIGLDSLSADVLLCNVFFYMMKNKTKKAFENLKKALLIDPNHFNANLQMGIFLRNYGLAYHSFKYFNKAIEINPLDPWDYCARGLAYSIVGEFEKALYDYRNALEIESNDYWTLYWYTELLIMLKKIKDAKKVLFKFENTYPAKGSVKYCKSLLWATQGDSVNAIKLFNESGLGDLERVYLNCILNNKNVAISLLTELQQRQKFETEGLRSLYMELKNLLWYDNLRDDQRFKKILAKEKEKYELLLKKYSDM